MKNVFLTEFGRKVKSRRIEMKMTQSELAEAIGFSSKAGISCIESGKRNTSIEVVKSIAKALNVEPSWLMGWEDEKFTYELNEYEKELIDLVRELPMGSLTKVINIVKALGDKT